MLLILLSICLLTPIRGVTTVPTTIESTGRLSMGCEHSPGVPKHDTSDNNSMQSYECDRNCADTVSELGPHPQ